MMLTLADGLGTDTNTFVLLLIAAAAGGAGWALWSIEQKKRREAERRLAAQPRDQPAGGVDRDRVMFELHRRINELGILKLEAEVSLLQSQARGRADDADRMQAAKEFHELTVEKTRLEIDSLRLHIAELRKRLDDFGLGG